MTGRSHITRVIENSATIKVQPSTVWRALTDPDPRSRSRHAPLSQQRVEGHEEVEVEGPKMNLIHGLNVLHPLDTCAPRTQIRLGNGGRTTPRS